MLQWIKGMWGGTPPASAPADAGTFSEALPEGEMVWRADTSVPIPDWERQPWVESDDPAQAHRLATAQAAAWVDAMVRTLGEGYARQEAAHFMLMSALPARQAAVLLEYLERSRRRVLATLTGVASDQGFGKIVVLVLPDEETYYRYVANYGSQSSEPEAFSGGMFIDYGYGHFVFAQGPFEAMEPVVVHELTHCLVRHLPLPAWLNEGLAMNTQHRFVPARARYRPEELNYLFGRFWTRETIQEFWSGKSFLRPDDGQPLSYELARILVQLLDKDYDVLARYCSEAHQEDGGERAALAVLGAGLGDFAAVVLGPGKWAPRAAEWTAGTEKGQF